MGIPTLSYPKPSLQRMLDQLVSDGMITPHSKGRARRYVAKIERKPAPEFEPSVVREDPVACRTMTEWLSPEARDQTFDHRPARIPQISTFPAGRWEEESFECGMLLKLIVTILVGILAAGFANLTAEEASGFNPKVLAAVRTMPNGGGYDGSDATKNLLHGACDLTGIGIHVNANRAKPSFCSGATYLVLLDSLDRASEALLPEVDQKDGHGVFGRWNSNGPGCAKLVTDLGAGKNFTSWDEALPGDFLKIWWTDRIGGNERGHHVVYLGHDAKSVRFWSSNQPGGYGTKSVPRSDCRRVLFTRITRPERFAAAKSLPAVDPWLARMLREDFTWAEVVRKCRVIE